MGGDAPLDWFGDFCDKAGVEYTGEDPSVLTKESLDEAMPEILEMLRKAKYDQDISWQALGVTILERGSVMSEEVKERILLAIDEDKWAREGDEERESNMRAFREKVEKYDGSPVDCSREEGLLSLGGHTTLFENCTKRALGESRGRESGGRVV